MKNKCLWFRAEELLMFQFCKRNIWEVSCQLRKSQVLRLGLNSVSQNLFEYVSRNPNIVMIEELNAHYILTCHLQDTENS